MSSDTDATGFLHLRKKDKIYLLRLARDSIKSFFEIRKPVFPDESELPSKKMTEKRGCFVTLEIDDTLRGCIGHIYPVKPLYRGIIENAVSAAFFDPRFPPLSMNELMLTEIEISVLTVPKKVNFSSCEDLLKRLMPGKHGVILKKDKCEATFLPQVWEKLPDKNDFIEHLCLKAGLSTWKDAEVSFYEVEAFSEGDFKMQNLFFRIDSEILKTLCF